MSKELILIYVDQKKCTVLLDICTLTRFNSASYVSVNDIQELWWSLSISQPLAPLLLLLLLLPSLLSRLESVGFWLADWPTDANLVDVRKHSETPVLMHIFLHKPTLCWCGCTAQTAGGEQWDPNRCLRSVRRREATGLRSHLTNRWLIQCNYNTGTSTFADTDRSQIPHLWNRVCLMNSDIIIISVDHRPKTHSGRGAKAT